MIEIHPIEVTGNWSKGFALDLHTISSEFLGYDEYGHEQFDTKRSEIGELLYRLKYRQDMSVINEIVSVVVNFLRDSWKISIIIDSILPVPPSNVARKLQPVMEIAKGISSKLRIPLLTDALVKTEETPQLKNVYDYEERLKLLNNKFSASASLTAGKNVLLFDDLYRSGATLSAITSVLFHQGKVKKVYVLSLTKTRSIS